MDRLPALLYRGYLHCLRALAPRATEHRHGPESAEAAQAATFEELDTLATRRGDAYRGLGVAVGLLGSTVIFLALAPLAFELSGAGVAAVKSAKVALMMLLAALVFAAQALRLKDRWIALRRAAETKRYEALAGLIDQARGNSEAAWAAVQQEVGELLGGARCQVRYHRARQHDCERIERATVSVTYAGFALSFAAALVAVLPVPWAKAPWLLLLTVLVPALVGALHGVNAFLRLPQLLTQHAETAAALERLQVELSASPVTAQERTRWLRAASDLARELRREHKAWVGVAVHQDVQPV
jgi:hypothetical protein